jgi:hypothetical protein
MSSAAALRYASSLLGLLIVAACAAECLDRRDPCSERDEFPPPAENKVKAIAEILGCDADDLLARAGRVSSDISEIIKRRPVELTALLRTTKGMTADEIARLARDAQKAKDK